MYVSVYVTGYTVLLAADEQCCRAHEQPTVLVHSITMCLAVHMHVHTPTGMQLVWLSLAFCGQVSIGQLTRITSEMSSMADMQVCVDCA